MRPRSARWDKYGKRVVIPDDVDRTWVFHTFRVAPLRAGRRCRSNGYWGVCDTFRGAPLRAERGVGQTGIGECVTLFALHHFAPDGGVGQTGIGECVTLFALHHFARSGFSRVMGNSRSRSERTTLKMRQAKASVSHSAFGRRSTWNVGGRKNVRDARATLAASRVPSRGGLSCGRRRVRGGGGCGGRRRPPGGSGRAGRRASARRRRGGTTARRGERRRPTRPRGRGGCGAGRRRGGRGLRARPARARTRRAAPGNGKRETARAAVMEGSSEERGTARVGRDGGGISRIGQG